MRVESLIEADDLAPGERWVTIRGNAVKINADGEIVAGPPALKGKDLDSGEAKPREKKSTVKPKQTDSPEFKAWFGGSKVVDEEGNPLIVYHGTKFTNFSAFDTNHAGTNTGAKSAKAGIWLSASPQHASNFAKGDAGNVLPTFVSLKNPLIVDHADTGERFLHQGGIEQLRLKAVATARKQGRDGVIFKNTWDTGARNSDDTGAGRVDLYLAFRPNQIKSATGNKGTFNPNSDDIRESRDRTPTLDDLRTASETKLQRILADLDKRHRKQLEDAIAEAGSVRDVPEVVWQQIQWEIEDETAAAIVLLMVAADEWTEDELRRQGVDGAELSTERRVNRYVSSALQQARDSAASTTMTTRARLSRKIEDMMLDPEGGMGTLTKPGIRKALDDVFTQSRRETMATDQTTGSFSTGQKGAAERLGGDGAATSAGQKVTIELRWETEQDNRTCSRCAPLQGQPEEVWGRVFPNGPGYEAHPNCRCWLRSVVVVEPE